MSYFLFFKTPLAGLNLYVHLYNTPGKTISQARQVCKTKKLPCVTKRCAGPKMEIRDLLGSQPAPAAVLLEVIEEIEVLLHVTSHHHGVVQLGLNELVVELLSATVEVASEIFPGNSELLGNHLARRDLAKVFAGLSDVRLNPGVR